MARDGYPSGDEIINKLMEIQGLELPDGKVLLLNLKYWTSCFKLFKLDYSLS